MDNKQLYSSIIKKYGSTTKPEGTYTERHHIVPKSLGGSNDKSNLVYLPARVHFICHRLLCKLHPESDKLKFAFWAMCNQLNGDVVREYRVTSKVFEQAKKAFAEANSRRHKGKKMSEEWCIALSRRMKGNTINPKGKENPLHGKPRSDKDKKAISDALMANPEKNYNFKGYYVTPQGTFPSAPVAAANTNYSADMIRFYCKNAEKLVTKRMTTSGVFHLSQVGRPLASLGWGFQPK